MSKLYKFLVQATVVPHRFFSLHKLPPEHLILQNLCRDFAKTELKPLAAELDNQQKFPAEQIKKLGQLGLLAINVDQKYGGSGYDTLGLAVAVEEISKGCAATGCILSIHNCLYANLLSTTGSHEQKEQFLVPFTKGNLGCFALSETDAGSDVGAISTTASQEGDHYSINGTKAWVTCGPVAKAAVVFATLDKHQKHKAITAFLLPLPSNGTTYGTPDEKLGIRASPTCNLTFENVKVPKTSILGGPGGGFKLAMRQLDKARVGIAAQALGIGQAALELAVSYASQRRTFGAFLKDHQAVKLRIAEMALRLDAARLLVWRAAVLCDQGARSSKESSMAKVAASEAATFITHGTIQILGGAGYVRDIPAERHYRDARITEIYAGVNDIQRLLIGENIIKELA